MLLITIPGREYWDEKKEEFVYSDSHILHLEHSLVSLSKWESKWNKVFLGKQDSISNEEMFDYIRCMVVDQDVDPDILFSLTSKNIDDINNYINASMTATYFREEKKTRASREQVTSELIYYWMISLNIPFECQNWHLNRLLTLIKVCNIKNQPPKKRNKQSIANDYKAINAARKKQLNTKG